MAILRIAGILTCQMTDFGILRFNRVVGGKNRPPFEPTLVRAAADFMVIMGACGGAASNSAVMTCRPVPDKIAESLEGDEIVAEWRMPNNDLFQRMGLANRQSSIDSHPWSAPLPQARPPPQRVCANAGRRSRLSAWRGDKRRGLARGAALNHAWLNAQGLVSFRQRRVALASSR